MKTRLQNRELGSACKQSAAAPRRTAPSAYERAQNVVHSGERDELGCKHGRVFYEKWRLFDRRAALVYGARRRKLFAANNRLLAARLRLMVERKSAAEVCVRARARFSL